MSRFSTREAAKRLKISYDTLAHYVEVGKVPAPEIIRVGTGQRVVHAWSEAEIEHVRQLLPRIANGRKTRYKKQSALSSQQSAKTKTPPRAAVPHKSRKPKKK
jgi:hypothetical protein